MASIQSKIARLVVRFAMRRPVEAHQRDIADQTQALRRSLEMGHRRNSAIPNDITVTPVTAGETRGEWVMQRGVTFGDRAILYIHGGAMVAGTAAGYRALMTVPLARRLGVPVFAVDYRRAPEHRFPIPLEDAISAYRTMRENFPAEGIIFAGDSAGGNLVLATLLALRERDRVEKPCAGVIAMSPWADLAATGASAVSNAKSDDMLAPQTNENANIALAYADREAFSNPLVSPLFGEYAGAPPILLFASTIEMLRDDSVRLEQKMRAAGVDVTLNLVADMPHVWPVIGMLPEAKKAIGQMSVFAEKAWSSAKTGRTPAGAVSI